MDRYIYKIATRAQWEEAKADGLFRGAPIDLAGGFIHFSTAGQLLETASKHFAGQDDLLLLTVEAQALGTGLRYEPSRRGDLFPHLYGQLALEAISKIDAISLDEDGMHILPDDLDHP